MSVTEQDLKDAQASAGTGDIGFGKNGKEGNIVFVINNERLVAVPNKSKGGNEKAPDFRLIKFEEPAEGQEKGESIEVGAGWSGKSQKDHEKIDIKIGDKYCVAVKRDKKDGASSKQGDWSVLSNEGVDIAAAKQARKASKTV